MTRYPNILPRGLTVAVITLMLAACTGAGTGSSSSIDANISSTPPSSVASSQSVASEPSSEAVSSLVASSSLVAASSSSPSEPLNGKVLYDQQCLECHGDENGLDVELGGALVPEECDACTSHEELAKVILDTMPLSNEQACDTECSDAVATYVLTFRKIQTGKMLYEAQCQNCHGDGTTDEGISAAQLIPASCPSCLIETDLAQRIHNTMPLQDATLCEGECADKIAAYVMTFNINEPPPPELDLSRPNATIENQGDDVLIKWQSPSTPPEQWYIERWSESAASWQKVATLAANKTQYRHTNHYSGYYRLYAITNNIASFPAHLRGDLYIVNTKGLGIHGTEDGFHFNYQEVTGDFTAEVTVESLEMVQDWKKIGIMARATLNKDAKHVSALLSPSQGMFLFARKNIAEKAVALARANTTGLGALRLKRVGNNFTLSYKQAGQPWQSLAAKNQTMPNKLYLGLATTSRQTNTEIKAVYSHLVINGNANPTLTAQDIQAESRLTVHKYAKADASTAGTYPQINTAPIRFLPPKDFANQLNDTFPNNQLYYAAELPKGDETTGYKVGLNLSTLDIEKFHGVAKKLSSKIAATEAEKMTCPMDTNVYCAKTFIRRMAELFARRPVADELVDQLHATYSAVLAEHKKTKAQEALFQALGQMPNFIYRTEQAGYGMPATTTVPVVGYEAATRLAAALWASAPDAILLQKAELGELTTPQQIRTQANRMMSDWRAKRGFKNFYHQWLHLESLAGKEKTITGITFNTQLANDMIKGLDAYVEHIVFGDDTDGTFEALMTEPLVGTSAKIKDFTGIDSASNTPEVLTTQGQMGGQRKGLLAQPAILTLLATKERSSIIERGVYVNTQFLCAGFPPPPEDVPQPDSLDKTNKTWRQIYEELTQSTECAGCHKFINPIGGAMEHFDGVGRYRTTDRGQPVDVMTEIISRTTGNTDAQVNGLPQLNNYLANSAKAKACFAQQYLTYAVGRGLGNEERNSVDWLVETMNDNDWNVTEMLIEATQTPAFLYKKLN